MGPCGGSWLHPGTAPSRWRKPGIQLEGLEQEGWERAGAERRNEGTLRQAGLKACGEGGEEEIHSAL